MNFSFKEVIFRYFSNTFLNKNYLNFRDLNITENINSQIYYLNLKNIYRITLNSNLLNHLVFKSVIILEIDGILSSIERDAFKN